MPGRLHVHDGMTVYHRPDGAMKFHGQMHSRHIPSLDAKYKAGNRPINPNYMHAGDGRPVRSKGKLRDIHPKKKKSKKGKKKSKKGRKATRRR